MKKNIGIVLAALTLLLASCEQLPGIVSEAKREVRKNLVDPNSAEFYSVEENKTSGAVCGFVNGKNRMGGYTGKSPFVYEKNVGVTLISEMPKERDFERYFDNIKSAEVDEYIELMNKCKGPALWVAKCGSTIFVSNNKYCELVNQGKSMSEVYRLVKQ